MAETQHRVKYSELPLQPGLPAGCAWGLYGPDDQLGTVNLLTPERVRAAATSIQSGVRFTLGLSLTEPSPPLFGRKPVEHAVMVLGPQCYDDRLDAFFPQASSQWDALSHFGHSAGFYNGATDADVEAGRLGIYDIAKAGMAGRGVLLDVAAYESAHGRALDPSRRFDIDVDVIRAVADWEGVEFRTGDILCIRTGWLGWYLGLDPQACGDVAALSLKHTEFALPGLLPSEVTAEFLWDAGFAAIATDTPAVESMPATASASDPNAGSPDATLHARVIGLLGFTLGEFFVLDALAEACAVDRRYDFFFTSAPLLIPGGVGSPPNALAIR